MFRETDVCISGRVDHFVRTLTDVPLMPDFEEVAMLDKVHNRAFAEYDILQHLVDPVPKGVPTDQFAAALRFRCE